MLKRLPYCVSFSDYEALLELAEHIAIESTGHRTPNYPNLTDSTLNLSDSTLFFASGGRDVVRGSLTKEIAQGLLTGVLQAGKGAINELGQIAKVGGVGGKSVLKPYSSLPFLAILSILVQRKTSSLCPWLFEPCSV